MIVVATSMFTLTDAIRQVEQALTQGHRLSEAVKWIASEHGIEASLLTRRWVQFTPTAERQPRIVVSPGEFEARYTGK